MASILYATSPSGLVVKIPLTGKPLDRVDISQRIVAAGIPLQDFPWTGYSLNPQTRSQAVTPEEHTAIMSAKAALPPFPPPGDDDRLPEFSSIEMVSRVGMKEREKLGGKYMMQRGANEWIDVLSLPKDDFTQQSDYDLIHSDRLKLGLGKVWRLADQQNIPSGIEYERTSVFSAGVTKDTTLEIEATLGYEGFGASVSLRVLFRHQVTISQKTEITEVIKLYGEEGKLKIFGLWQECDIMTVEIDGVRQNDPVFSIVLQDKNKTPYLVIDRFDGILNPLARDENQFLGRDL